jgi:hypothetical protein
MTDETCTEPCDTPPQFQKIPGIDYILLTNISNGTEIFKDSSWDVKIVETPTGLPKAFRRVYANRWYKWHPSSVFGDTYDVVIYVDGWKYPIPNYADLWMLLAKTCVDPQTKIALYQDIHECRQCIYEELAAVIYLKKDTFEHMKAIELYLLSEQFPEKYGLLSNSCYVYAVRKNPSIEKMWDNLWNDMLIFGYRDQVLYMYHLWKSEMQPHIMQVPLRSMIDGFCTSTNGHTYIR